MMTRCAISRWMGRLLVAGLLAFCVRTARAADEPGDKPPALWFPVGENMHYHIFWSFIPVGEAQIVTAWTFQDGRRLLVIRMTTRTNKVVAQLYPVEDLLETWIDPVTFLPVRQLRKMNESSYHADQVTWFDYAHGVAHWDDLLKHVQKDLPIVPDTRDALALMYYLRREPLPHHVNRTFSLIAEDQVTNVTMRLEGREKIKVGPYGRVDALRVEVKSGCNGLFVSRDRLLMWVSADARQLCPRMEGSVAIGRVIIVLEKVLGPGDDRWAKPTPSAGDPGPGSGAQEQGPPK